MVGSPREFNEKTTGLVVRYSISPLGFALGFAIANSLGSASDMSLEPPSSPETKFPKPTYKLPRAYPLHMTIAPHTHPEPTADSPGSTAAPTAGPTRTMGVPDGVEPASWAHFLRDRIATHRALEVFYRRNPSREISGKLILWNGQSVEEFSMYSLKFEQIGRS